MEFGRGEDTRRDTMAGLAMMLRNGSIPFSPLSLNNSIRVFLFGWVSIIIQYQSGSEKS